MTARPHDAVFKAVFEVPAYAVALCEAVLPADVSAVLAWSTLQLEAASFVDEELADTHGDLLFSAARTDGARTLVYVLVEHQSRVDEAMPLRLLGYLLQIWQRERRAHPGQVLPVIIPVVVSHAPAGWTAPRAFDELFGPAQPPALDVFVPRFQVVVEDLAGISDAQILARVQPPVVRLVWWLLRDAREPTLLLAEVDVWAPIFEAAARTDQRGLVQLIRYLTLLAEEYTVEAIRARLGRQAPLANEVLMSAAETWFTRGREQGREEGLSVALRRVLTSKFGALSPAHEAQLTSASAPQLETFLDRVLTAATIDDVLRA